MAIFQNKTFVSNFLLVLAAVIGGTLLSISTRIGPGIGGDSTIYIVSARNLLAGEGLGWIEGNGSFSLLADFPPGYPLILALFGLSGLNLILIARWMNVILFALIIWLCGKLIYKGTNSTIFATLTALIVAFSPVLIPVYAWAMSEPLFIFLGFVSIYAIWIYLIEKRSIWLFIAICSTGFAFITRYSGIIFLALGGVTLLIFKTEKPGKRLLTSLLFAGTASIPMLIWEVVTLWSSDRFVSRQIGTGEKIKDSFIHFFDSLTESIMFWLLPDSWIYDQRVPKSLAAVFIFLLLVIVLVWIFFTVKKLIDLKMKIKYRETRMLLLILLIFTGIYFVFLLMARLLVFPIIAINNRMISPIYISILLMLILLCFLMTRLWQFQKISQVIFYCGLGLMVIWYARSSYYLVGQLSRNGLGFTSKDWLQSELIAEVKQLPSETKLVTNEPKAVLLLTERNPYALKEIYLKEPLLAFYRYGEGDLLEDEGQSAFKNGAALVLFNTINRQMDRLYSSKTQDRISVLVDGLNEYFKGNDGSIYFYQSP